jgi:hypothetical protein
LVLDAELVESWVPSKVAVPVMSLSLAFGVLATLDEDFGRARSDTTTWLVLAVTVKEADVEVLGPLSLNASPPELTPDTPKYDMEVAAMALPLELLATLSVATMGSLVEVPIVPRLRYHISLRMYGSPDGPAVVPAVVQLPVSLSVIAIAHCIAVPFAVTPDA